jgi:hypothetical protein
MRIGAEGLQGFDSVCLSNHLVAKRLQQFLS